MKKGEIVFSVLAILASMYLYMESAGFFAAEGYYSTVFYTQFLSAILFFLTLLVVFQIILRYMKNKGADKPQEGTSESAGFGLPHLAIIGILIACPIIFKYLGFMVAGGLFLVFTMFVYTLHERKKGLDLKNVAVLLLVCIGVLLALYVLFHTLLRIPLPRSSLIS